MSTRNDAEFGFLPSERNKLAPRAASSPRISTLMRESAVEATAGHGVPGLTDAPRRPEVFHNHSFQAGPDGFSWGRTIH